MPRAPSAAFLAQLKTLLGPDGYVDDPDSLLPHLREWRDRYQGATPLMMKPRTTAEVAAIVGACAAADVGVVAQGGNTGLVGGQIPRTEGNDLLIHLGRLNRVRAVDPVDDTMTVEAGVTLAGVQAAAEAVDRLFPLSLAAEGTCQIGGNLSTNAGGVHVLRYGNARDLVLGLEVVTPDGQIWNGLRALRKDNTGPDLKQLYLGTEGTFGIITAAVLKLFPRHRQVQTVFAALPSPAAAVAFLHHLRGSCAGDILAFELIPRFGLQIVIQHIPGTACPLTTPSPWYVLVDLTVSASQADAALEAAAGAGHVTDGVRAQNSAQAAALWRLRESLSEAQKPEGGSIKHDISVPVSRIPEFLEKALDLVETMVPGIRPVPFGHVGDGNLHFNLTQPAGADTAGFMARRDDVNRAVHDLVHDLGGSISAEHGIGRAKRDEIRRYKSAVEMDLMTRIKEALDPKGIMNPGKGVG